MSEPETEWDGALVRRWLESRIAAARSEQIAAERGGRDRQDDCDKAAAEELVCAGVNSARTTERQETFLQALTALLDREDYVWRGVYDDRRFDRHVRSCIKKVMRMAKANAGFANIRHYQ